jgi:2-polyprenyl-3-methyl-5-hydroxy-6-metoxy-1,4-benzoquinol methylase
MKIPHALTRQGTVASITAADAELADTLDNLDGADNYTDWIFEQVEPHLGKEVLEVGAGHGTLTGLLSMSSSRVVATDVSERCAGILRTRFADDPRVTVLRGGTAEVAGLPPFDAAVLINVLEHIEDDEGALRDLLTALKPGGRLILWVPAFEILYSDFDQKIGHHRRYRMAELRARLSSAGYEVTDIRYINSVGALAWLIAARLLHRVPTGGRSVKLYDSYVVPVLRQVEGRWGTPFGQSLFAVATRPAEAGHRAEAT